MRVLLSKIKAGLSSAFFNVPVLGSFVAESRRMRLENVPRQLNIEVTSQCNAKCIMCPRQNMARKMEVMPFSLYEKIIEQAKALGIRYFALNGYGEIFTAKKDYEKFIAHLRSEIPGASILINTNGSLMDEKAASALIDLKVNTVHIDIDGATKDTFEKIRPNLKFEMVTENVKRLLKIRNDRGERLPVVRVGILSQEANRHEVPEHQRQWIGVADYVGVDIVVSRGGSVDVAGGMVDKGHPCYLLWSEMNIWSDGSVALCCDDWDAQEKMGSIKENSIVQIWNSEKYKRFRKYHAAGEASKIEMCRNCTWARRGPKWFEDHMRHQYQASNSLANSTKVRTIAPEAPFEPQ